MVQGFPMDVSSAGSLQSSLGALADSMGDQPLLELVQLLFTRPMQVTPSLHPILATRRWLLGFTLPATPSAVLCESACRDQRLFGQVYDIGKFDVMTLCYLPSDAATDLSAPSPPPHTP